MTQYDLNKLSSMHAEDLAKLYETSVAPKDIRVISTSPIGHVLAAPLLDRQPLHAAARWLVNLHAFPWKGKDIYYHDALSGVGINLSKLLGITLKNFTFDIKRGKSLVDGNDAVVLTYDLPDNLGPFRRSLRDEVRQVAPGIFIGPVLWTSDSGSVTTLTWFALEARDINLVH